MTAKWWRVYDGNDKLVCYGASKTCAIATDTDYQIFLMKAPGRVGKYIVTEAEKPAPRPVYKTPTRDEFVRKNRCKGCIYNDAECCLYLLMTGIRRKKGSGVCESRREGHKNGLDKV